MVAAYPLLGVGPDNFRLTYPRYAGTRHQATRARTANNMYLEVLAGADW
jgi:hypothetical protein